MSVVCRATNRIVLVRPACTLLIVSTELWFWTLNGVISTLGHYTQNLIFLIFVSFCKKSGMSVYT
jgi:hypothetical protein